MDLDIEMGDGPETLQEKYDELPPADDILQPEEEPGEVPEDEPPSADDASKTSVVPTKIHIRGLDTLHTDDIKSYVKLHYGPAEKIEWIDDTSANLTFPSEPAARDALTALSAIEIADATALAPGETLPAKSFDGRPEISLHVRFAVEADRKQAGAALRSRYYLLHPEHDPEEKRRRQLDNRSRYRERERRNGDGGRRGRREGSEERESFEASMYDDAPRTRDASPGPDDRTRSYAQENQGKELFSRPIRREKPTRDRSASPRRASSDDGTIDSYDDRPTASRDRLKARSNQSKELFPSASTSRFGGGQLDHLDQSIGSAHLREEDLPNIVAIPDIASASRNGGSGVNIRGIATQRAGANAGISIKGTAGTSAKELFPGRFGGGGNAGKELISKRRQRAEDLFS